MTIELTDLEKHAFDIMFEALRSRMPRVYAQFFATYGAEGSEAVMVEHMGWPKLRVSGGVAYA